MSDDSISAQPPPTGKPRCPYCGAEFFSAKSGRCWLCDEKSLAGTTAPVQAQDFHEKVARIQLPQGGEDNPAWAIFGVLAVLLLIGLASAGPGILIVLLIIAIPAMVRAAHAASRQAAAGKPMSGLSVAGAVLSSIGIVALVALASFAAFYATCFVVCLGGLGISGSGRDTPYVLLLVVSISAGLVPGLWVAYLLFRRLWS